MKIRWTASSIRLRISPPDLAALQRDETVREALELGGPDCWSATIVPGAARSDLSLSDGALLLYLSVGDLAELSIPESEGVYLITTGPNPVHYIVEKDFPCAHPRPNSPPDADDSTFSPPADFAARKSE